jgi:hypothetical protein
MTKSAVTIPFLLSVPACSFVVASLKWFKKEWISLACLPVLTLLLITPYILIVQLGLHVGDKIEPYAITNTLVMPSVFFGVISILGIIINALIPKYIKVRI